MGFVQSLIEAGLDSQFEMHLSDYFVGPAEKKDQLRDLIDERGVRDPVVLKTISDCQKKHELKPGLYVHILGLLKELDANAATPGGNGNGDAQQAPQQPQQAPQAPQAPQEPQQASQAPDDAGEGETDKDNLSQEDIQNYSFSDEQEEIVRQRLAAEEEKIRQRLLKKELKIRENLILGRKQRQLRLGLKAEDAAALRAAREKIKQNNAVIKELRAENEIHRATVKKLRPRRQVSPMSHEAKQLRVARRKLTMAERTGDPTAIAAAQEVVKQWEAKVQE